MDRFNSNEEMEDTPLSIAKDIIYSDTTLKEKVKLIEAALIKAENLPISDLVSESDSLPGVSERKWSVDEIIEKLESFRNIEAAPKLV